MTFGTALVLAVLFNCKEKKSKGLDTIYKIQNAVVA
jgi:hypothetical protein